jgi:predicted Co/Zn/Cd cation transporter (cation efflux family)
MESKTQSPALTMRVMKYAFVVSAFLFIFVAIKIPVQPGPPVSRQLQLVLACVGLMSVAAGCFVPRFVFQAAQRTPQNNSAQAQLQQWMTKGVLSLAFFEACILLGFALHFLHGSVRLVWLLFGVGIAAELFWSPAEPPGAEEGKSAQA